MPGRHHVYILACGNNSLYTGYTVDLKRRFSQHQKGIGSKFTRSHLPVRMVYHESYGSKSSALKRERAIKQLSRSEKLLLIQSPLANELV